MQEIATVAQGAASLHGHVPGNLFYPRLVVSDANDRAARLAAIPAGESPANRRSPVTVVVITSNGEGDQSVESLVVKAPEGWSVPVRSVQGGEQLGRP